ncbi:MAG: hypothetical protein Q4B71_07585 [Cardiobacteriaceae bacterium]|nr:hypothetical protein [Cardiobacteriaceae bacterium]
MAWVSPIWSHLSNTKRFEFIAQSLYGSHMNWNMHAFGTTQLSHAPQALYFHDTFYAHQRHFSDQKGWILRDNTLEFWHFRAGSYQQVFVFDSPYSNPHHCQPDVYQGYLEFQGEQLVFQITIVGQRKNERLTYRYFA